VIKLTDEYDVTYAVKEWLIRRGWSIVAFNPPGSQGTFTIPNPLKDPRYRGQTGSKSPDIIAIRNSKYLLIIESKPTFVKKDVVKLMNLVENKARLNLLLEILEKMCTVNNVKFDRKGHVLLLGKAHGGGLNPLPEIETFRVLAHPDWDAGNISATADPFAYMKVTYYPSSQEKRKLIES